MRLTMSLMVKLTVHACLACVNFSTRMESTQRPFGSAERRGFDTARNNLCNYQIMMRLRHIVDPPLLEIVGALTSGTMSPSYTVFTVIHAGHEQPQARRLADYHSTRRAVSFRRTDTHRVQNGPEPIE